LIFLSREKASGSKRNRESFENRATESTSILNIAKIKE